MSEHVQPSREALQQQLQSLNKQLEQVRTSIKARFEEIAGLTEQLAQEQEEETHLVNQVQAANQQLASLESEGSESEGSESEASDSQQENIELVASSNLFDADWYLETYQDVAQADEFAQQPATHYTLFGGFEGRNPCPEFDSRFYLQQYDDVRDSGINPLVHYLKYGRDEGRLMSAQVEDE
ncbi:MAG TPA: hypothetical protein DEO68_00365 [Halomonas campaniensis]|uniref:Uncharacterized protein n=1 Tax=Halomonas campaniensis TaxID=213554 RepID=A0A3D0KAU2_9GAMM|nr:MULTISPECIES: hypothetical protein [unclassified Halomonas]HCA00648.1 hypothetical protein [Halomonas campaniensis]